MNGADNSFAERLFAPSSSIQLASGVLAGSPGFLCTVISTRFQHLLNEFHAAKPFLTGFCGCHVGSSTPVEGRLVEMRSGRARRQLPLVRRRSRQHVWWGLWLGYSTVVWCQWAAGCGQTRKYDARNPCRCGSCELSKPLLLLSRIFYCSLRVSFARRFFLWMIPLKFKFLITIFY